MAAIPSVLFVCLGNICRSPLAEAALRAEAEVAGVPIHVDSAGTGNWHVGRPPDSRAQATALKYGVDISQLRARQVTVEDFHHFDLIFALDGQNLADLEAIAPADGKAELLVLLDLVHGRSVQGGADPYYGDLDGFDVTWADVSAGARAILAYLSRTSGYV